MEDQTKNHSKDGTEFMVNQIIENKEKETNKTPKFNTIHWAKILWYNILYTTYYDDNYKGYFCKRRFLFWICLSPVLLPCFMIIGFFNMIVWIENHDTRWIEKKETNLTLIEKTAIILRLKP